MTGNTSHAVRAQRHEPHDSLDFFPTPPWATRALCRLLVGFEPMGDLVAWEPACGEGHMARPLAESFGEVIATDVHPYGFGAVEDFLWPTTREADWIITNPPFRLAEEFALTAIGRARRGVALLVRSSWIEGIGRYERLFSVHTPTWVCPFVERVPMVKGRLDPAASTATAYCWIVWRKLELFPRAETRWIAPCRSKLERPEDYAGRADG
jgi:hypothetical protein